MIAMQHKEKEDTIMLNKTTVTQRMMHEEETRRAQAVVRDLFVTPSYSLIDIVKWSIEGYLTCPFPRKKRKFRR